MVSVRPTLCVCEVLRGGFMVGCGVIGDPKLIILDHKSQLRRYLGQGEGF